jgi:hypothetical protein
MAKYTQYFVLDDSKHEAKCKLCVKNTIIKYSNSSKSNLKTHVEGVHKNATAEQRAATAGCLIVDLAFKGPPVYSSQHALTDAIGDMIVDMNLPLTMVENHSFRKVLAIATTNKYKPVCFRTIRERIMKKGLWRFSLEEYKIDFGKPSTTVDIWSSRKRRGYMAVSLHLQSCGGLITKVLDLAHIPSPHTGENIKCKYDEILAAHGLSPTDAFKTVCDNASNMKKAFRVSLWEQEEDIQPDDIPDEEPVDDAEAAEDIAADFVQVFNEQYRNPCTIHTLQLLVKDCLEALPLKYKNVLSKAKVVCRRQHQSTKLSEAMTHQLPCPGETR